MNMKGGGGGVGGALQSAQLNKEAIFFTQIVTFSYMSSLLLSSTSRRYLQYKNNVHPMGKIWKKVTIRQNVISQNLAGKSRAV